MDVSHVLVGTLTVGSFVLLVWAELRSRRNRRTVEAETEQVAKSASKTE